MTEPSRAGWTNEGSKFKSNFPNLFLHCFALAQSRRFYEYVTRSMKCHAIFTTRRLAMAISSYIGKTRSFYSLYADFYSFSAGDVTTLYARITHAPWIDERSRHIYNEHADGPNRARVSITFYFALINLSSASISHVNWNETQKWDTNEEWKIYLQIYTYSRTERKRGGRWAYMSILLKKNRIEDNLSTSIPFSWDLVSQYRFFEVVLRWSDVIFRVFSR